MVSSVLSNAEAGGNGHVKNAFFGALNEQHVLGEPGCVLLNLGTGCSWAGCSQASRPQ